MEQHDILGIGSRVKHPAYGDGVIIKLNPTSYDVCFTLYGIKSLGKEYAAWEIVEHITTDETVTFNELERSLIGILKKWSDISEVIPLGDKWKGGLMILKPGDESLKSKEIPIETFFHKIVMVRDRIRVMEQRINASNNLNDEEKINLQQYITRIYGSLTTFNVLFRNKSDSFTGEKSRK
ncbi:MAG: hypothetical protein AAFV80_05215 [Bacteroidota bacterium]